MSTLGKISGVIAVLGLLFPSSLLFATPAPYVFSYQGRMTDQNGKPIDGPIELNINFYNISTGGSPIAVGPIDIQNVALQEGIFLVDISLSETDFETVFPDALTPVYIEVTDVTHGKTYSRQRFSMLPYALRVPLDVKALRFDSQGQLTLAPTTGPAAGQFLTEDGSGNLIWASPSGAASSIDGQTVSSTAPTTGQVLSFDGTKWTPTNVSASSGGTVTSVGVTAPLNVTNATTTPQLSITQASSVSPGYLSSADWLTFNGKEPAVTAGTTSQYYRGDKTWQALNASAVAGLGTAATLNVGTGANNIVQLNSSGKLPAVDGSALTGLTVSSVAASSVTGLTSGSIVFAGASGLTEDNSYLFWSDSLYRLGIGTKTPSTNLSFGGTSAKVVGVERNSGTAAGSNFSLVAGGASMGSSNLNGGDLILSSGLATGTGTSNIQFQTAGGGSSGSLENTPTTQMTILGNGKVGVGTATPDQPLTVAGKIHSTSGGFEFPDGTVQTTSANFGIYKMLQPDTVTPPTLGNFSWVNQSTATASQDSSGSLFMLSGSNGSADNINILAKSAPATPWTVTVGFVNSLPSAFAIAGLCLRESSTGKMVCWMYGANGNPVFYLGKYNSVTSYSASYANGNYGGVQGPVIWERVTDDGTNLTFYLSGDGRNFVTFYQVSRTDWMASGPDTVGMAVDGLSAVIGMSVVHWSGI